MSFSSSERGRIGIMRCVMGNEAVVHLSEDWDWKSFQSEDLVYGGFLWSDIRELSSVLPALHSRLLKDFRSGWSGVALTARGGKNLGPFAPPTAARAHASAPQGLYLLSADRLRASLEQCGSCSEQLPWELHRAQLGLGSYFCDPNLEVELLDDDHNFAYTPPNFWQRLMTTARYLFCEQMWA